MYGVEDEDLQNQFMDEDSPDDSDIPSAMVIHEALGVMVLDTQGMALSHCVSQAQRDQNGGLVADTMGDGGPMILPRFGIMSRTVQALRR